MGRYGTVGSLCKTYSRSLKGRKGRGTHADRLGKYPRGRHVSPSKFVMDLACYMHVPSLPYGKKSELIHIVF